MEKDKRVSWLVERQNYKFKPYPSYNPAIHIDVYGTLEVFDNNLEAVANYMVELGEIAKPYQLRVEGPLTWMVRQIKLSA